MTPQEEQLAMQAYVRQQLLARQGQQQQLNLAPGQQPLAPGDQAQFLQRQPLAPGVGSPSPPEGLQIPGAEVTGDYATGPRMSVPQGSAQLMYRKNVPFASP